MEAMYALMQARKQAPHLPSVPALRDLYDAKITPRRGEVIMIVGREGSGKSTLALYLAEQMQLETLYFCADMSALEATQKLASQRMGIAYEEIEESVQEGGAEYERILHNLSGCKLDLEFGHIQWEDVECVLDGWAEEKNRAPEVIVFDNLLDIEDCYADYTLQEESMQFIKRLSQETGATIIVMHHTTKPDRSTDWTKPPSTSEIKGNLGRVPQMILSVALDAEKGLMNVSCLKQRMGPCDKSGKTHAQLRALLEFNRFERNGSVEEFRPREVPYDEPTVWSDEDERAWQEFVARCDSAGGSAAEGQHEVDWAGQDDPRESEDVEAVDDGDGACDCCGDEAPESYGTCDVPSYIDLLLLYDSTEVALSEQWRAESECTCPAHVSQRRGLRQAREGCRGCATERRPAVRRFADHEYKRE